MCKARDTFDMLVSMEEVIVIWMTKVLEPQELCCIGLDCIDWCKMLDVLMKGKAMVHHGHCRQFIMQGSIFFFLISVNSLYGSMLTGSSKVRVSSNGDVN